MLHDPLICSSVETRKKAGIYYFGAWIGFAWLGMSTLFVGFFFPL